MDKIKDQRHTRKMETDWIKMGVQAKEKWCSPQWISGPWMYTSARGRFHR